MTIPRWSPFCRNAKQESSTVSLSIVWTCPSLKQGVDAFSSVYVSDLLDLQLMQGQVCWLMGAAWKVAVILREVNGSPSRNKKLLLVPPCLAASLGKFPCTWLSRDDDEKFELVPSEYDCIKQVPLAESVTLMRIEFVNSSQTEENERIKDFFSAGRLISCNTVCGLPDSNGVMVFYVIIDHTIKSSMVMTSPDTRVSIQYNSNLCLAKSLPHPVMAHSYFNSVMHNNVGTTLEPSPYSIIQQHNDRCDSFTSDLAQLLQKTRTNNDEYCTFSTSKRCILITGHPDNDLNDRIDEAAWAVGMPCLHICGLAQFAYSETGNVHSGGIADRINAVKVAFGRPIALPHVIHFAGLDQEFTDTERDIDPDRVRNDEERFLALLQQEMASNSNAIVVLSSQRPLSSSSPLTTVSPYRTRVLAAPSLEEARLIWHNAKPSQPNYHWTWIRDLVLQRFSTASELKYLRDSLEVVTNNMEKEEVQNLIQQLQKNYLSLTNVSHDSTARIPRVYWKDIGALSDVREEIMDAIQLPLQHPHLFKRARGLLLFGPPGSGKTLVAKAVATECQIPFFGIKGPELLGTYVGESEANVRRVFDEARRQAVVHATNARRVGHAVVFFDELDSLAPRRGKDGDGGGIMDRVATTLLGELDNDDKVITDDGSQASVMLFVMGATNRPDLLDPALLRPGRLDRHVYLGLPTDDEDRIQILAAQMSKFKFGNGLTAQEVARAVLTDIPRNLSGADLSAISSGAMRRCLNRICGAVEQEAAKQQGVDLYVARQRVIQEWESQGKLEPLVTREDVILASQNVAPSVSTQELLKYEALRQKYSRNVK